VSGQFHARPLYLRGNNPRYPLDRRLGGPESQSGRRGEETILDPTGTRTPTSLSSSPWQATVQIELTQLCFCSRDPPSYRISNLNRKSKFRGPCLQLVTKTNVKQYIDLHIYEHPDEWAFLRPWLTSIFETEYQAVRFVSPFPKFLSINKICWQDNPQINPWWWRLIQPPKCWIFTPPSDREDVSASDLCLQDQMADSAPQTANCFDGDRVPHYNEHCLLTLRTGL
jgi:hypothetical protein